MDLKCVQAFPFVNPHLKATWKVMDIKQRLYNTLIPILDLFGVKWEILVNIY